MADYYPLIARAVHGLSDQSREARQHVYSRAREALTDQLRNLDPPLDEEDIIRQQDALEDSIARLEAEFAPVSEPAPTSDAVESEDAALAEPEPEPAPVSDESDGDEVPPAEDIDEPIEDGRDAEEPLVPEATSVAAPDEFGPEPQSPPEPQPPAAFGGFGHEPARVPGTTPEPVSGEFDPPVMPPATKPSYSGFRHDERAEEVDEPERERVPAPIGPARPRIDSRAPVVQAPGRARTIVFGSIVALVVGAIAVLAYILRDQPSPAPEIPPPAAEAPAPPTDEAGKFGERIGGPAAAPTPAPAPAPAQPAQQPAARPEVAVAQRAILYEENPSNPQEPVAHAGRVTWRLDAVSSGQGQPLENAVRATVEIPESELTLNFLLRRNLDPTLPASHTLELSFVTKAGDPGRVVRDANVLQFKNEQNSRGTPMAGLAIPVRENMFLIGLSSLQGDIERNTEFLLQRNWMDLPIRLASGKRAILSFEKGRSGEQVMSEAFQQWQ
ncbi:hypothetical protein [Microvirga massiliensis]|uniref:hypothetical protein n=1 Tax=Microvirga massiliensis TaxID=1033741 RepID=UPI00062BD817|nr:hypothetical protein [Microvirga massiliensis]